MLMRKMQNRDTHRVTEKKEEEDPQKGQLWGDEKMGEGEWGWGGRMHRVSVDRSVQ